MNGFTPFYVRESYGGGGGGTRYLVVGIMGAGGNCTHASEPDVYLLAVTDGVTGSPVQILRRDTVNFDGLAGKCLMCESPMSKEEE